MNMKTKTKTQEAGRALGEPAADRESRINAGWLKLWKAVYPGTSPPTAEGRKRGPEAKVHGARPSRQSSAFTVSSAPPRPAAVGYLSRFLCVAFTLSLLLTGCAGTPLKGGKAAIVRSPSGLVEQTVVQGQNASQPTRQDQEILKLRSYTLPAGSRVEQSPMADAIAPRAAAPSASRPQPSTPGVQPSTCFVLSAPTPVVEQEHSRARTELGAAQKDTARELGAKLSSLKGIVWVGVGLFVFGIATLVYPPLKVIVASVTTSLALTLGGVALMVLPTMVVGNELLILGVVGLVVGAWFLAHRHGQLRGLVAASSASVPAATAAVGPSDPEAKTANSNH
jgi:hypothetical protein